MNKLKLWNILACSTALIFGTLFHFIYEWIGGDLIAVFGAVNESTWEHLKLLFWPMLFIGIAEYFIYGKNYKHFAAVKTTALLLGMLITTATFYTYKGILGFNFLAADILTFVLGVCGAYLFGYFQLLKPSKMFVAHGANIIALCVLLTLVVFFAVFTFYPPHIGLFEDPISGKYGILK